VRSWALCVPLASIENSLRYTSYVDPPSLHVAGLSVVFDFFVTCEATRVEMVTFKYENTQQYSGVCERYSTNHMASLFKSAGHGSTG
jgi:hypothetical protein